MHHKQESVAMLSSILPDKPPFIATPPAQDAWLSQAILRRLVERIDVDVAVRAGQHAGSRTARPRSPTSSSSWATTSACTSRASTIAA